MLRLPFRRGKGRNKVFKKKPITINIKVLNIFPKSSVIDIKTLTDRHVVDLAEAKIYGVKVLGDGEILIPLEVKLPVSKGAKKKIEKAGGSVI
ncbi:MAG: uL15 family ribosomal protein [Patescibacteria group bacterium]|nr:uL15 family ribosomal protein [Patescibacteria group bacterium]